MAHLLMALVVDPITGKSLQLQRDLVANKETVQYEELCYLFVQWPFQDAREVSRTYINRDEAKRLIAGLQHYLDSFEPQEDNSG